MACILDDGRLTLTGDVGDYWLGDCFTYTDVLLALSSFDDKAPLTVVINSGGGVASEGAAIHALLSERAGRTDMLVHGGASSAASLIAMAGDTVFMSLGSYMMIHDPSGITLGTSAEHAKAVEMLEAMATGFARVYAKKSGKSVEACREIMRAERWLTPEEAIAEGFADELGEEQAPMVAAFDYRRYEHAPRQLTALARKRDWTLKERRPEARRDVIAHEETATMPTDKERAEAAERELAELKAEKAKQSSTADADELATLRKEKQDRERADAILALDEAKGREPQAKALATAGVTIEHAKAVLAAAPKPADETEDEERDDPQAYERQRLAGAGMRAPAGGDGAKHKGGAASMVANMKKLLNQKEAV